MSNVVKTSNNTGSNMLEIPLPKFNYGDTVYYDNSGESMKGCVININYNIPKCVWTYLVCFGPLTGEYYLVEQQLSKRKIV